MYMTQSREKRAVEIQDSIRKILYQEWDPIGVSGSAPDDEYDTYIAPVYRILAGSRSEREIVEFLFRTECETIGMSAKSSEHLQSIAQRLLELDVRL
jgi:hypothetical protein